MEETKLGEWKRQTFSFVEFNSETAPPPVFVSVSDLREGVDHLENNRPPKHGGGMGVPILIVAF